MIVLSIAIRQEKEIEDIKIRKKETKWSLLPGGMIIYVENPTEFTKQLIELGNESSKITGYKVYIQNSIIFLYPGK